MIAFNVPTASLRCRRHNCRTALLFATLSIALCLILLCLHRQTIHAQSEQRDAVSGLPVTRSLSSTIQRMRNRGDLLVVGIAYDYAPFGSLDANGEAIGFEPDLVRALAALWDVDVAFVPISPSARIQNLLAGQVDLIAAALPHTLANENVVDFSNHYFVDTAALLLPLESQTLSFDAISGQTVAIVQDGSPMSQFTRYLEDSGTTVNLLPFQEHGSALRALTAGQADALLANYTYLAEVAAKQTALSVILPFPGEEAMGFGIAPGDSLFRNMVDASMQELYTSGVYAEIFARWFPNRPVPALPLVPGEWLYTMADLPATTTEESPSVLAELRANGMMRVGVHYDLPPLGYLDDTGKIQGFEIDLVREFARRWFGDVEALALVRVTPDTAIPLLQAGQVDLVAAALPYTWPNEATIDFSLPYYADSLGVLVPATEPPTTLTALHQRPLAVVGTVGARTQATILFDDTIQPQLLPFQEYRAAEHALLAGQVDGLLGSTTVLARSQSQYPDLQLLAEQRRSQTYGIGIPASDHQMRDLVNLTLQVMKLDGAYDNIYSKWFGATPFAITVWPGITADVDLTVVEQRPATTPILQPTVAPPSAEPAATPTRQPTLLPTVTRSATAIPLPTRSLAPVVVGQVPATNTTAAELSSILVPTPNPTLPAATDIASTVQAVTQPTDGATLSTVESLTVTATLATTPLPAVAAVQLRFPITVTVLGDISINARTGPTTAASVVSLVSGGTIWPALALSDDGEWVQIALSANVRGWVARRLLVEAAQFEDGSVDSVDNFTDSSGTPTPTELPQVQRTNTPLPPVLPSATPTIAVTPTPRLLFATNTTHRITATDSLASIAQQYYDEQRLWTIIYDANRDLIGDDPNVIPVGAELVIPPKP